MRQFVTPANVITSGNMTAGFLALAAVHAGYLLLAAVLVVVAGLLDSLDGPIARRGTGGNAFGTNLDSLADLVSFGVTPALALYLGTLQALPGVGLAACVGFVICGGWRLARFPLIKNRYRFTGLPIPPAGVLAVFLAAWGPTPLLVLPVTVVLSVLMVSSFPFPTITATVEAAASMSRRLAGRRSARG